MSEKKTIIVAGYGPGASNALAERFGQAGFRVALVARNARRLDGGVEKLSKKGIEARAFPADLADEAGAREVVKKVREAMGPVDAIAWVAYANTAGDVLATPPSELRGALDLATTSLVAAVQEALPDLRARKGAVLVTNGGFGLFDEGIDAMVARGGSMGLAISNSAKHKLVGLLPSASAPTVSTWARSWSSASCAAPPSTPAAPPSSPRPSPRNSGRSTPSARRPSPRSAEGA